MSDIDHYPSGLAAYGRFEFDDGRWKRPVYRRGAGPAVIVIHEMPGLHPSWSASPTGSWRRA